MIGIVDYGLGNLASVKNAMRRIGVEAAVTADPDVLGGARGIVLPGVGSALAGMERIRTRGLDAVLRELVASGTPILGLCLGMQLLFEWSEEGDTPCLGLLSGEVRRLQGGLKVPQIGWNSVDPRSQSEMFAGAGTTPYFYFVHSYICVPRDADVVAGTTEYGETFCSAVQCDSIWGTQFHPERSGSTGLRLLERFAAYCGETDGAKDRRETARKFVAN